MDIMGRKICVRKLSKYMQDVEYVCKTMCKETRISIRSVDMKMGSKNMC